MRSSSTPSGSPPGGADDDVAVTLDVVPGVPHMFQAFAALLDQGEAALTWAGAFLREHTGPAAA